MPAAPPIWLKDRVSFRRRGEAIPGQLWFEGDNDEDDNTNWVPIGEFWAHVEPVKGTEIVEAAQNQTKVIYTIRMRNVANISARDQMFYKGSKMIIGSVILNEQGFLEILAYQLQ